MVRTSDMDAPISVLILVLMEYTLGDFETAMCEKFIES